MNFLWVALGATALFYAAFTLLVYLLQRRMQYFPERSPVPVPPGERYRGLEEVELVAADGVRLFAWHWPGPRAPTVVLFHGNAGHRGTRLPWMGEFHDLGFGVFCLDYRGYGGSRGSPSERGLYLDADAAIDWLEERAVGGLVYLGQSIGCGVAVEMAVRKPPVALILQSGFVSLVDVARKAYPYLPVRLLMKDRFDCREKIDRIGCPLLMVHGEKDSIIPASLGKALFDVAPEPKEWLLVPAADHNDPIWIDPTYMKKLEAFLSR